MKKKVKWLLAGTVLFFCAVFGILWQLYPTAVAVEPVKKGELLKSVTVQAFLEPEYSMILNSPSAGTVTELPYRAGMKIEEGGILVRTGETAQAEADVMREQVRQQIEAASQDFNSLYGGNGSAQPEYAAAKSEYELAEKRYADGRILAEGGYLAQRELEELKTTRDAAYGKFIRAEENNSQARRDYYSSRIASLKKQLAALETAAASGTVLMPYDGVLWELLTEKGAYIEANQPVARVYSRENMKLKADLLSEDAADIKPGMEAQVFYADGTEGRACVSFVSDTAVQKLSQVGVEENRCAAELIPDTLPAQAGAGLSADVIFTVVRDGDVYTVPASAIVPDGEKSMVYLAAGGRARTVLVETGRREGGRVEILSGLEKGSLVVTDPYEDGLKEGSRVKAVAEERLP